MSHARQQIRDAFATQITGLASGATVYKWRARPVPPTVKKAFRVSTPDESIDNTGELGAAPSRVLSVRVEILTRQAAASEDVMDQLALEVESAIAADETIGGRLLWCRPVSFDADIAEGGSETEMLGALLFEGFYSVALADASTII